MFSALFSFCRWQAWHNVISLLPVSAPLQIPSPPDFSFFRLLWIFYFILFYYSFLSFSNRSLIFPFPPILTFILDYCSLLRLSPFPVHNLFDLFRLMAVDQWYQVIPLLSTIVDYFLTSIGPGTLQTIRIRSLAEFPPLSEPQVVLRWLDPTIFNCLLRSPICSHSGSLWISLLSTRLLLFYSSPKKKKKYWIIVLDYFISLPSSEMLDCKRHQSFPRRS